MFRNAVLRSGTGLLRPLFHQTHETGVAYICLCFLACTPVASQKGIVSELVEIVRGHVYVPCRDTVLFLVEPVDRPEISGDGVEHRAVMDIRGGIERSAGGIAQYAELAALLCAVLAPSVSGDSDREEQVGAFAAEFRLPLGL